jgi:hypothetical protein
MPSTRVTNRALIMASAQNYPNKPEIPAEPALNDGTIRAWFLSPFRLSSNTEPPVRAALRRPSLGQGRQPYRLLSEVICR